MKILKIRLKNIQSLYGEHEIDFSKQSFVENPIFLITGDTGSGKTSILDVVTLALYSRTTRHGNEKAKDLAESVMSRSTTECFAEVQFEVNGKQYKSRWESDRRFNRKLDVKHKATDPIMTLVNMHDNTENKSKKQEVLKEIERIIQLDFEQFLRSVMLAQGEFTKFLKAKPKERAELLEKMTGTVVYQQISAKVFEKHKQESNILDNLKQQIEQVQILSTEDLDAKNREKNDILNQISHLEAQIQQIEPQIAALQNLEKITREIAELQKQEQQTNEAFVSIKPKLEELNWHEKAMEFETDLKDISRLQNEIKEKEQKIQDINKTEKSCSEKLQKAQQEFENQNKAYQLFKSHKAEKEKIIREKLIPWEVERQNLIQELAVLEEDLRKFEEDFKRSIKNTESNYKISGSLSEAQAKLATNKQEIIHIEQMFVGRKNATTLQKELQELNEERLTLQKWENIVNNFSEKQKELSKKQTENQQDSQLLQEAKADWERKNQEITDIEKEISLLQIIVEQEKLIASYEKQRQSLRKGEPCPLCGATHHPFAEHLPPNELSEHQKQLQNLQKKFKELQNQISQNPKNVLESQIEQRNKDIGTLQEQIKEMERKMLVDNILIEVLPLQIKQNNAQLKLAKTELEKIESLEKNLAYLQNEALLAEEDRKIWEKKTVITNTQRHLAEIEKNIVTIAPEGEKSSTIIDNLQQEEAELSISIENFQKELHKLQNELQILTEKRQLYAQAMAVQQDEYKCICSDILPKIAAKGFANTADLQAKILPKNTAQSYRQEQEKLQNDLQKIQTLLSGKQKEKSEVALDLPQNISLDNLQRQKAETLAQKDELIKNLGLIDAQIAQNENEKKKAESLQKEIKQQEQVVVNWGRLNHLIGSAKGDKFREFAQSLTLQRLVALANTHLKNLNKRYLIRKAEPQDNTQKVEEEGLDLEIIDREQADTVRPIESLSGGESFLVSLSLALGLSDLASKNVQIDTLFIDEGFGTLDENTLDTAIEALETLQHKGKTIGIISHVKELKGRIKQQIKVKKIGAGRSTIEELPY